MELVQGYGSEDLADRQEVVFEESFIIPVRAMEAQRQEAYDAETALYAAYYVAAPTSPWADTAEFPMNKPLRASLLFNLATTVRDRADQPDPMVPLDKQESL